MLKPKSLPQGLKRRKETNMTNTELAISVENNQLWMDLRAARVELREV
jgi:hypothetical protein